MDNRIFEFDNRFPDRDSLDEVVAYLRELSAALNTAFNAVAAYQSGQDAAVAAIDARLKAVEDAAKDLDERVTALEEEV